MSSSQTEKLEHIRSEALEAARAVNAVVEGDRLVVTLEDGRVLATPLSWFPRLVHASPAERANLRVEPGGDAVWWDDLDDGVEVVHLLLGWKSGEGRASFTRWLEERAQRKASA